LATERNNARQPHSLASILTAQKAMLQSMQKGSSDAQILKHMISLESPQKETRAGIKSGTGFFKGLQF
jgi:hypothetical protein